MAIGDKSITLVGAPGAWGSIACWLNPPYGKTIGLWLSKAREAALAGATVALIPRHRHDRERDSIFARPLAFRRMQTFRAVPERGRNLEAVRIQICRNAD
jgi:hypothetical protein